MNLPEALANPIFVFKSNPSTTGVLTVLKSNKGENLFVAIELSKDLKFGGSTMVVNDILTIHSREIENVILPIVHNGTLVWIDKQKGLEWLHSAKSKSQANTNQVQEAAKIVENFENPTIGEQKDNAEGEILFRKNQSLGEILETAKWAAAFVA